uniref:Protein-tyrosine-phosphatase n=1 Tax=Parastrongyloides trichosuri TaxID=131310 RepID=A0A0N5A1R7_PARTI
MKTLTGAAFFSSRSFLYSNKYGQSRNNHKYKLTKIIFYLFIFLATFLPEPTLVESRLLQGCGIKPDLCEKKETCYPDGVFGQCGEEVERSKIMDLSNYSEEVNKENLLLTLDYSTENGNWDDDVSQCLISLYKFTFLHNFIYQPSRCNEKDSKTIMENISLMHEKIKSMNEDELMRIRENLMNTLTNKSSTDVNKTTDIEIKKVNKKDVPMEVINEPVVIPIIEEYPFVNRPNDDIYMLQNQLSQLENLIENDDNNNDNEELVVVPIEDTIQTNIYNNIPQNEIDSSEFPQNFPIFNEVELENDEDVVPSDPYELFQRDGRDSDDRDGMDDIIEIPSESSEIEVVPISIDDESINELVNDSPEIINPSNFIAIPVEIEGVEESNDQPIIDNNMFPEDNIIAIPLQEEEKIIENIPYQEISPELFDKIDLDEFLAEQYPESNIEIEEAIPLNSEANGQQVLLKKDDEKYITDDLGLENTEHKIVKGNGEISMIEGNRIYVNIKRSNLTEEQLFALANYLQEKIGDPNELFFHDFEFQNNQLSFKAIPLESFVGDNDNIKGKRVDTPSGVAQAVYKRRKDILTLSGIDVNEAGIGSGKNTVPVVKEGNDWLFKPILLVCMGTVTSLLIVLLSQVYKSRKRNSIVSGFYPEVIDHMDNLENGKAGACAAYEELCRRRMSGNGVNGYAADGNGGNRTKLEGTSSQNSSVSSWPDEAFLTSCNLDISTGHVILSFLQSYLDNPQKIHQEWESVVSYKNNNDQITIASRPENLPKNRNQQVLPYDESLVILGSPTNSPTMNKYINASNIYDVNPKHPSYIAAESPVSATIANFWQMIWEKGVTILVNLTTKEDMTIGRCEKYWPDDGSKVYDNYEVHLVSEHIWSEDYMVRSFYLKNIITNETRTVTQFHYLAWPENKVVPNQKTLLDFRRKVNKSYRGHASPILVHCSEGLGRTGAYLLLDMTANRITSGVKEINMAASLEYLRDNRNGAVNTEEQYKMVFSCLAEEVTSLIKNLPN